MSDTTPSAPWKVDFYEGDLHLDSTLLACPGYELKDVLLWARARYAAVQQVRGTDIAVRISNGDTVLDHDAVLTEFAEQFPGAPWQQVEPVRLRLLEEVQRDLRTTP